MDFDENVFGNDHAKRVRGSDSRTQLADAWFEAQSAWTLCVAFRQNVDRDIRVALTNISRKSKIDRSDLELPSSTSPNYLVSLCACISRLESSVLQLNVLFIIYKWIMQTFSSCQSQSQSLTPSQGGCEDSSASRNDRTPSTCPSSPAGASPFRVDSYLIEVTKIESILRDHMLLSHKKEAGEAGLLIGTPPLTPLSSQVIEFCLLQWIKKMSISITTEQQMLQNSSRSNGAGVAPGEPVEATHPEKSGSQDANHAAVPFSLAAHPHFLQGNTTPEEEHSEVSFLRMGPQFSAEMDLFSSFASFDSMDSSEVSSLGLDSSSSTPIPNSVTSTHSYKTYQSYEDCLLAELTSDEVDEERMGLKTGWQSAAAAANTKQSAHAHAQPKAPTLVSLISPSSHVLARQMARNRAEGLTGTSRQVVLGRSRAGRPLAPSAAWAYIQGSYLDDIEEEGGHGNSTAAGANGAGRRHSQHSHPHHNFSQGHGHGGGKRRSAPQLAADMCMTSSMTTLDGSEMSMHTPHGGPGELTEDGNVIRFPRASTERIVNRVEKPKKRTAFTVEQTAALNEYFAIKEGISYSVFEIRDIAAEIGLTEHQVRVYFQNRRARSKQRLKSQIV